MPLYSPTKPEQPGGMLIEIEAYLLNQTDCKIIIERKNAGYKIRIGAKNINLSLK